MTGYIVEQKLRNGEYRYRDGGAGLGMRSILSHWVAVDAATSTSFQPNSLEVVGEVLQHRQQRFRFARHLYFPNDLACVIHNADALLLMLEAVFTDLVSPSA